MSTQQAFRLEPEFPDENQGQVFYEDKSTEIEMPGTDLATGQDTPLSVEAVTLAGHMGRIQAKLEAEMQRLEAAGIAVAQSVSGINPTDQATYTLLCERLTECKKFYENVEEWAEPWRSLFFRPYKAVLDRVKIITMAPIAAHDNGKNRRLQFERAVKAAQEAETLRLQKEARDREEAQRLENAVKAEELGLSPAAVETILTQPSVAPTPVAAPMISRPTGVRKIAPNWQAELTDKAAFWKWAKAQKEMPAMLTIDFPTMNREAKTHRATLGQKYPGFRGVNRGGD
jgi:hypothetical protein